MKFPKSWLHDFIDIDDKDSDIAEKLSIAGLEVEEILQHKKALCHVISVKIQKINKHPEADRLVITQCYDGQKTHQIVTGATNINEGDIVPLALPGAILAKGLKIKESQLRGIDSAGMLCSESELGLYEEANGIWILDKTLEVGLDLVDYFKLNDAIFDVGILPNRGDCQSMFGLARELGAILNKSLKKQTWKAPINDFKSTVIINNTIPEKVTSYSVRQIKNCQNSQSPSWLKARLWQCGLRPRSLSVDITNYVLLEYGQPLHAFSEDKLNQDNKDLTFTLRFANKKETITTLDQQEHSLNSEDIIIDHHQKAIAIGGIMGSLDSACDENASQQENLILESANFNAIHSRRSAQRLNLRSESAIRFEKGVDLNLMQLASDRAAYFYQTLCNAVIGDLIYKQSPQPTPFLPFNSTKINAILGANYSQDHLIKTLKSVGFLLINNKIQVPSWRVNDCKTQACLAEEVARLDGFSQLNECLPPNTTLLPPDQHFLIQRNELRDHLAKLGFHECTSYPMISEQDWNLNNHQAPKLVIQNPISQDLKIMRNSLLSNLLKIYKNNQRNQQNPCYFFEVGHCFNHQANSDKEREILSCALIIGGHHFNTYEKNLESIKKSSLNHLKSVLTQVCHRNIEFSNNPHTLGFAHPKHYLSIHENKQEIGHCFEIHPQSLKNMGVKGDVFFAEFTLKNNSNKTPRFKAFTNYPSTKRDIAILSKKTLTYQELYNCIQKHKSKWVKNIQLVDIYEGEQLKDDQKSLAFSLHYQSPEKSLTDDEVNQAHALLCQKICQKLNVQIR